MNATKLTIPALLLSALLCGCSLTPDYQRPAVDMPAAWSESGETAILRDWWTGFDSAELNALMAEALLRNNDLLAGLQRIEQARASLKIAGADLLPSVGGSAGASRTRTNPDKGKTTTATSLRAGLDIAYELDLFGANRAGISAAEANLRASQYDQDALSLITTADVATGYFTLLNLRERLSIADNNLSNAHEVLRIVTARAQVGTESDIELARQESAVASSEASRTSLLRQIENAENALAVLTGRAPGNLAVAGESLSGLNIPQIDPGQPSTLLERRPDLRAAEAGLIAANANIGAARAAFFPSITLNGGANLAASGFGDPATTALSLASSLVAPIFQGGRLEGGVEQATARQMELAESYRKTVLTSFQEVADALAAVTAAQARETSLEKSMLQARKAYQLTKKRYDAGTIDFQTLLDTQSTQLSAEDNFSTARLDRLNAAIDLYKALGGGWV